MKLIRRYWPDLDKHGRDVVFRQSVLYVTRNLSAHDFQSSLAKYKDECTHFKSFRLALTCGHYFYLAFRYFAIFVLSTKKDAVARAKRYGIFREDAKALNALSVNNRVVGAMRRFKREKLGGKTPLPGEVRRMCQQVILSIRSDLQRIVRHKLRFVSVFNQVDPDDLFSEVQARVIQQFYWAFELRYPKYRQLHALQVAHKYIINLQYHWTAKKRHVATERDRHGISKKILVNESCLPNQMALSDLPVAAADEQQHVENQVDAQRIMVMYGTTRKKRTLLKVLSGVEHADFNAWLRQHHLLGHCESHVELQDQVNRVEFLAYAADWLCIRPQKALQFVSRIREEMTNVTSLATARSKLCPSQPKPHHSKNGANRVAA